VLPGDDPPAVQFIEDPVPLITVRWSVPLTLQAPLLLQKRCCDFCRQTSDVFFFVLAARPEGQVGGNLGFPAHEERDGLVDDLIFAVESLGDLLCQEGSKVLVRLRSRGMVGVCQGGKGWERRRRGPRSELLAATDAATIRPSLAKPKSTTGAGF